MHLEEFIETNIARVKEWHPDFGELAPVPTLSSWTSADWSNAMCGEAGEAANVVKKLRRIETGIRGTKSTEWDDLVSQLGKELADVITYATILAEVFHINLPRALVHKFNEVSEKNGMSVFMFPDGRGAFRDDIFPSVFQPNPTQKESHQ